ncbi:hypothetical protein HID58_023328 [Brassica napus]|uniref:Uncharacterized protein n=1 Tax=Brassica napus TaxID=3708 RepID=A0ABQ8D1R7_BRANA|nr:hypothetical protein HID58_023328 [Brassica napus]
MFITINRKYEKIEESDHAESNDFMYVNSIHSVKEMYKRDLFPTSRSAINLSLPRHAIKILILS